ncbi:purple acid phosphatase family protein [Pedosphaera parvula]|uniref:acid phosphatase n=1 Tax=Pedosphaera parvula (strain Ellin514) TaxID=320771 RepID=B9XQU4_PEDPL|nr:tartrate-resistant acid phosphatase type 5 family protein [Pedosphaera parvula]EEF57801.1 Acid phosphatase [Pedosphaera parvula Ellin514]
MKQTRREFVRKLFVATQVAVASRFLPDNLLAAELDRPLSPDGFNFIVFGDWGRNGERDQSEVAAQMALAAKATKVRFIISAGDNFYDNGVASASDPQWQTSFEHVYRDPALQIPWHVILGNHDYNGNCDAQLEYARSHPRWNMPARYYLQTHHIDKSTTADFFYLDTSPMIESYHRHRRLGPNVTTQDVKKQIAWFKNALIASQAQWKIVIGHHPIYSGGEHGDTAELIKDVLPLLQEHKVQAWFNGHDHDLQHLMAGDLNLFCCGAGSQVRNTRKTERTKFAQSRSGFTTVSLRSDRMRVHMTDNHGQLLYHTDVPVKSV